MRRRSPLAYRVGLGDGREQRVRVRVAGVAVDVGGRTDLDDLAEVHDRDAVGDVPDDGQVVRDEQERERHPVLQLGEQVEHLGLDRDVERGDGLVEHDDVGLERERPRDPDALALAAGELVRVAGRVLGPQAHHLQQLGNALARPRTGGPG